MLIAFDREPIMSTWNQKQQYQLNLCQLSSYLTSSVENSFLTANSLWYSSKLRPNEEFVKLVGDKFSATFKPLDLFFFEENHIIDDL